AMPGVVTTRARPAQSAGSSRWRSARNYKVGSGLDLNHCVRRSETRRRESGILTDPQHVLADLLRGRARGQHGPAGRLEVQRQEAGCNQSGAIKYYTGQQTVYGLWMERRERVRGVGLEAEQLAPPSCPGGAARVRLIRTQS